ncbi:MAG: DHHW family protein [Oscillospiraceae bacterium]
MKKSKQLKISAFIFLIMIVILPLATAFSKKEEKSEMENRTLAQFPKFSIEKVLDKSFMNGFDTYISDHFIGRINWIELKVDLELTMGKKEINGIYVTDDMLIEKLDTPNYEELNKSIEAINNLSQRFESPQYFVMIAPTSAGIYTDKLPTHAPQINQKELIDYIYNGLSENITSIDIYNSLYAVKDEYIYYRNDHHWTSLGAYYGYNNAIQKLGFTPISYDKFNIEHVSDDFKGTFYSKALYDKIKADTIDIYSLDGTSGIQSMTVDTGKEEKTFDTLYDRSYLNTKDKYAIFLSENNPKVTIKTNAKNDKKILIIKDSYANCFVPFLTEHYNEITLIDLRYIGVTSENVVNINDYNQVLFLYNASTIAQEDNLKKMDYIFTNET